MSDYVIKNYDVVISALKNKNWLVDEDRDKKELLARYDYEDDFPMGFLMWTVPSLDIIKYVLPFSFKISEEKRLDAAVAVSVANYALVNGSFDYNIKDGSIEFRMGVSCFDCVYSEDFFIDLFECGRWLVNKYIKKFYDLSEGTLTLKEFIESENE